jgi:hypothetical protein
MNKKKILFINHKDEACGVYQYGKRVASILLKSNSQKYNYFYIEIDNKKDYFDQLNFILPDIVIHNYLDMTMPWFDMDCLTCLKSSKIPQGLIVHNIGYANVFDFFIHQNPLYVQNGINYSIPRPLFNYNSTYSKPNKIPKIHTFGFGFIVKEYEKIVELINDQLDFAEINMHLTYSKFCPNYEELEKIKLLCFSKIKKDGIKLNITSDFKSDLDILDFLNTADLNIFLYKHYDNYNGISSVIDYALSVKKPIAICKSNMFAHINNTIPSICIENQKIIDIINNGIKPLENIYNIWSNEKFIQSFESILDIEHQIRL